MANFPVYHGITLASGAYIENLNVEQLVSDPVPVSAGRVWYNTTDKVFRQSTLNAGGAVVVRTFATAEDLVAATGDLSTLTTTAKGNLVAAINEVDAALDAEILRATGVEGDLATLTTDEKGTLVDAINEVDAGVNAANARIDALGNAFNYVGALTGGADTANAFDLSTLAADGKNPGDYYKVTTAGYFKIGAAGTPLYANTNDGLVWNISGGIDKIDNTDSTVAGTANEIAVTGSTDTGYTVAIDSAFKARVSTLETEAANAQTAAGLSDTGTFVAISGSNYLDTATSLRSADLALDAAIAAVQGELDTTQGGSGLAGDGSYVVPAASNYLGASTSLADADAKLDAAVKAEVDARTSAVSNLQTEVDTTQTGAGLGATGSYIVPTGTTYLGTSTSLANADVKLDTAIKSEVDTRVAQVGDLGTLTTTEKTNLVGAVNELNAALAGGTEAVRDAYDATIFTYESTVAAATHVLTHNLGSPFIDFSVMIQRADGFWYNDIASIQMDSVDPTNKATLYLSSALNVRVIARSAVKIGLVA